ncbi:MAG: hypothetical protein JO148_11040 [Acidimicrobiia bacterium]|nr:hypothetical protein [Acidimicrobiia bacterium]
MTRSRLLAVVIAVVALACVLGACSDNSATPAPPKPLTTPKSVDDLTGIWRTVRQNTLELRKTGAFTLISPVSQAMAGNYALNQDRITFSDTKACGSTDGVYRIQAAAKDHLVLSDPDDACSARRTALTSDPFIYAQPDFS